MNTLHRQNGPQFRRRLRQAGLAGMALTGALALATAAAQTPEAGTPAAGVAASPTAGTPDLEIVTADVQFLPDLDLLVFNVDVAGEAGGTTPEPHGTLDGAPVLGYVVPTSLEPAAVGFDATEGIATLAVTSHPDFDDTPLWDETGDGDYANDGMLWHTHWVLVGPDERVPGGLAVLEVNEAEVPQVLPPTAPGLPLFLDSPGFPVQLDGGSLRVVVPAPRIAATPEFSFDAATAYLQVNTADPPGRCSASTMFMACCQALISPPSLPPLEGRVSLTPSRQSSRRLLREGRG